MLTYDRSAFAIAATIFFFYFLSLQLSKKLLVFLSTLLCIIVIISLIPQSTVNTFLMQHFYKNATANNLFRSRDATWEKSYQHAVEGGWFGAGYGANIGENHFKMHGLTSSGYGREKGNAEFASLEETGIIGFSLYLFVLITFFMQAIPSFQKMSGDAKVIMGLLLGGITGLLLESLTEAWWDVPGGQETICFWALVGLAYGMIYMQKHHPTMLRSNRQTPVPQHSIATLYPVSKQRSL